LNIVEESSKIEQLKISPELDNATIIVSFNYELDSVDSREGEIELLHELNYQRSNGRWLLSAPVGDYWQGSILDEGHYISIRYPGRDHYFGEKLAVDLEALTAEFCSRYPSYSCNNDLPINIEIGANPKTITQNELQQSPSESNIHIDLPTPTIFGLPENDMGYRALYRALGRRLVATIVMSESGWVCCDNALFFQSLLDYQFVQLALKSPVPLFRYEHLNLDESLLAMGARIWSVDELSDNGETSDGIILANLLVEYLSINGINMADSHIQQNLRNAQSFHEWLLSSSGQTEAENLIEGWNGFLYTRLDSEEY
jgi:hypothetical protein